MADDLQGFDQLLAKLTKLEDKKEKRIARAGVSAGIKALVAAQKAAVNSAPISGALKAAARKAIGKRIVKDQGAIVAGKAGFGVGKSTRKKRESAHQRHMRGQGGAHETKGVGASAANIHWFVLGTQERETAGGHGTGEVPSLLAGAIQTASTGAGEAMINAARDKIKKLIS